MPMLNDDVLAAVGRRADDLIPGTVGQVAALNADLTGHSPGAIDAALEVRLSAPAFDHFLILASRPTRWHQQQLADALRMRGCLNG